MILSDFSVLLLAWDDADPSVAVLGGTALPPTLPLAYQLAAQRPVLAVYPHLPATAAPADGVHQAPTSPGAARKGKLPPSTAADASPAVAMPGVRQLPNPGAANQAELPQEQSHLVGLADLTRASRMQLQMASALLHETPDSAASSTRTQWPTPADAATPSRWQAPAVPYAGASANAPLPQWLVASPLPGSASTVREATALPAAPPNGLPPADSLNLDPKQSALPPPPAFAETTREKGSEAADFSSPDDNLTAAPAAHASGALPVPSPASIVLMPAPEGLNFRMIQYARRAAQLVRGRLDFGVIYAPNWPAWLAALEIRNSSGRPLVLYAANVAADFASPPERGWLLEVERMTLRRAHLILVPDQGVHRRMREQYGATIGEVRVVPANDDEAVQRMLRETAMEIA